MLIAAPLIVLTADSTEVMIGLRVDSFPVALPFGILGVLLIPLAFHITNLAAAASATFARGFLGWTPLAQTPGAAAAPGPVDRAATAAFTWEGVRVGGQSSSEATHVQAVQTRLWIGHLVFFALVAAVLVVINGLSTPSTWWAIWPIWGFGIAFAAHTGYFARGFLGAHTLVFAAVNLGLFVIDSTYSANTWFYWPLLAWALVLGVHAYAVFAYAGTRSADFAFEPPLAAAPSIEQSLKPAPEFETETSTAPAPAPLPTIVAAHEPPAPRPEPAAQPAPAHPLPAIAVDPEMHVVTVAGVPIEVTPKEFELLVLFSNNPGRPFSREELLDRIWKNDYEVTDRTIDTHIQRLRKKLGVQSEAIQTVWGIGYRYQPPSPEKA